MQRNPKLFAGWKPHFSLNCQMPLARSTFPWIDSYLPVPKISSITECQNASSHAPPCCFHNRETYKEWSRWSYLSNWNSEAYKNKQRDVSNMTTHLFITTRKSNCKIFLLNVFFILIFFVLVQTFFTSAESVAEFPDFNTLLLQCFFHMVKRSVVGLKFKFVHIPLLNTSLFV